MKTVITGTIHNGDFESLKQLMRGYSSCMRYAYQRIHKDKVTYKNDIVKACKPLYMPKLNQRYIQDAVMKAKDINQEHALFGGRKNWKDYSQGYSLRKTGRAFGIMKCTQEETGQSPVIQTSE